MCYGMRSDFMPESVHVLDSGVVGVFMGDIESSLDVTPVGIPSFLVKYFSIQVNVVIVDGVIERNSNHLWNSVTWTTVGTQTTRDSCPVFATEAVWELTNSQVAGWGSVWICVLVWE